MAPPKNCRRSTLAFAQVSAIPSRALVNGHSNCPFCQGCRSRALRPAKEEALKCAQSRSFLHSPFMPCRMHAERDACWNVLTFPFKIGESPSPKIRRTDPKAMRTKAIAVAANLAANRSRRERTGANRGLHLQLPWQALEFRPLTSLPSRVRRNHQRMAKVSRHAFA